MSGDDSGQGSSTSGGTANDSGVGSTAGDGNQTGPGGQGSDEPEDNSPPPQQGPSGSSGSGGSDQDPPENPKKVKEEKDNDDEEEEDDDDNEESAVVEEKDEECEDDESAVVDEEDDEESEDSKRDNVQNGKDESSPADPSGKDFEPITTSGVVPTYSGRGRPPGGGRGSRGGRGRGRARGRGSRGGRGRGSRSLDVKPRKDPSRVYKKRERKAYKPSEMVRREFIKSPELYQPIFPVSARRGRGSRGGRGGRGRGRGVRGRPKKDDMDKQEDSSSTSWDKDISDTLKEVINKAYKAKKFKAVGKKKKAFEDDSEDENLKHVKLGMMAYPVIQINKKSDTDIDAEAKYTFSGYCCNDCGAVYQSTAALRRHQTFECGKEPQFKCEQCDYAAKHKGTLKSHIKNRHLPRDGEAVEKKPRKPRTPSLFRAPSPI